MSGCARQLVDDGVVVFLFHGVIERRRHAVRNYTGKHLLLADFAAILDELRAAGNPVGLPELLSAARGGGALPRRAFAITFDDGFRNNATLAAPALDERSIPATFYVTSGFVEKSSNSRIDMIEQAVSTFRRRASTSAFPASTASSGLPPRRSRCSPRCGRTSRPIATSTPTRSPPRCAGSSGWASSSSTGC